MRKLFAIVVFGLGFGLAACGGGSNDKTNLDNNSTVREVCTAFAEVACDKAQECDGDVPDNCVNLFVDGCCAGGGCEQRIGNASAIESCLDDISDLTCAQLENEDISLDSCEGT